MTDPLEALEALVEKWRYDSSYLSLVRQQCADELEPIIQRLRAQFVALKFNEREWRDKAQDKIAEVESLRAERERYREALNKAFPIITYVAGWQDDAPQTLEEAGHAAADAYDILKPLALQASSPKEEWPLDPLDYGAVEEP